MDMTIVYGVAMFTANQGSLLTTEGSRGPNTRSSPLMPTMPMRWGVALLALAFTAIVPLYLEVCSQTADLGAGVIEPPRGDPDVLARRMWEQSRPNFEFSNPSPDGRYVTAVDWDSGDGYYCWRYPEASLSFYHSYEDGFKGRVPIN